MNLQEQINQAETRIFKTVFPNTTNHDTLFENSSYDGRSSFYYCTRFTEKRCVTVSSDKIDFTKPIPAGTIIELIGTVTRIGNTSLDVKVEIYIEQMYSNHREKSDFWKLYFCGFRRRK
jgi:acyl-CoA hydrolase